MKGKKRQIKAGNIFSTIPEELPEESIMPIIEAKHLRLERIVSKGHVTSEGHWYYQDQDEWVMVLRGEAVIRFERADLIVTMGPGDYVFIPAHERHRVEWTSEEEVTVWLALHFGQKES